MVHPQHPGEEGCNIKIVVNEILRMKTLIKKFTK